MAGQSPAAVTYKFQLPLLIPLLFLSAIAVECRHVSNFNSVQRPLNGLRIDLLQIDSLLSPNITSTERVKRSVHRSQERFEKLQRMFAVKTDKLQGDTEMKDIEAPLSAGSAEFLMQIAIGTPALSFLAIVDTGSDLLWTKCKPCTDCPTSVYDPSSSPTYSNISCNSSLCQPHPNFFCNDNDDCAYTYGYADHSQSSGILSFENFALSSHSLPNPIAFGCSHDIEGVGFNETGGLVGFGRGALSLVSQLGPSVGNKFSYCLVSATDSPSKTSPLFIGQTATSNVKTVSSTPILQNSVTPSFYYLSLEGISVAGKSLNIPAATFALKPDGTGGLIIDSGTTVTYLPQSAYDIVKEALTSSINLPQADTYGTGLDLCFNQQDSSNSSFPTVTFHFQGADYDVPRENYLAAAGNDMLCVFILPSMYETDPSIFGNVLQQNHQIVFDNENNVLSFAPTVCDAL